MRGIKCLILVIIGAGFLFAIILSSQKISAADSDVVISEVMANAPSPEEKLEWIELFNNSSSNTVSLNGWTLDTKAISDPLAIIQPQSFLILARSKTDFLARWTNVDQNIPIIQVPMVLTNSADTIVLKNKDATYSETFSWATDTGDNLSWERIDPTISSNTNWHVCLALGGTPGAINSVSGLSKPHSSILQSPALGAKFFVGDSIVLTWDDPDPNIIFEVIISKNADLSDPVIDEPNIASKSYTATDLDASVYYWQVIASNGVDQAQSEISNFIVNQVVYSDAIIINELFPDPTTSAENEWIELYNDSNVDVNLRNWTIEDLKGSIHKYKISSDLVIPAYGYLTFKRTDTGITLNNDQDGARLTRPDNIILYETPVYSDGDKDWAYARNLHGTWEWTTTPTQATVNIITAPVIEDTNSTKSDESSSNVPINSSPVNIDTGEYKNYRDYLVTISGEVIQTSGNTFYLDDGTGEAKVYIQDSSGIDKPPMHKGDIFEVTGIVNLYRSTYRILPQKQDDVQLIEAASKDSSTTSSGLISTAKAAAASKTASGSANARAPGASSDEQVAGASSASSSPGSKTKTPWWANLLKVIVGIAVVILIIVILQIVRLRQNRPKYSDFGDET